MQYKLDNFHKNKYIDFTLMSTIEHNEAFVHINGIRTASKRQMRNTGKYDLSIRIIITIWPEVSQMGF